MCGIAGLVAWDDRYRVNRETLQRLSACIAHRGPDGQGLYLNHEQEISPTYPQVGLVHRRLAIIDLDPRANQPFSDSRGRQIVFNGEIYNYRQLRAELTQLNPDYPWRTTSDTEVLLAAYATWGEKCLERLNGMFAFAIWDEPTQSLFLARDRMGQKPLYMATPHPCESRPGAVAFASELDALRQLPWFDATMSTSALRDYLSWGCIGYEGTIYATCAKLAPAMWRRVSATGQETQYYFYSNEPARQHPHPAQATRQLIEAAVRRQMVSDVPLGCLLSGGIDSSVVAAAAQSALGKDQPLLTFSIGFEDARYDESEYAAAVARHLGTRHHRFIVRPDAAADLPKLAAVFGEPFADSSALPTHYLAQETRPHVKVALSGDGGDELFGGYDRYQVMKHLARLGPLTRPAGLAIRALSALFPGVHPKSRLAGLKRLGRVLNHPTTAEQYAAIMRFFDGPMLAELLGPDADEPHNDLARQYQDLSRQADPVQAALALDRITYLPDDLLTKLDRASMLHALEVRSPFMDHELVQFAASLSTDQLLGGGPKRMLREAFAADLPDFVFKRRKMGFAVPIGDWFRDSLRPMLHDLLFASDSFAADHFRRPFIQQLIADHEQFRADHSQRLYALLMLELWWRTSKPSRSCSSC
ncbi:MAG TPA: asparagine synthase (glutamine-hydrolyzing) [Tepidisphaeraceae bacterium]|nr:asparagine synthase (glutamine-hydrolyzing) [Tepidisphaeraceae bacterium]